MTTTPRPLPADGPWLTLQEANDRLRYKSRYGIYKWLKRHGIPKWRRGRQWLVARADIDRVLTCGAEQAVQRARMRIVGK